jgi:photosynthetic reaction center cytochrome c subunit
MLRRVFGCVLVAGGVVVLSGRLDSSAAPQQAPQPAIQDTNDNFAKRILGTIAGRETEPAGKVFKNITLDQFKDIPARRLVTIMNLGYSRALGVTCTHCHVEEDFASDEKRPKRAAREMAALHRSINDKLRTLENLKSPPEQRSINCSVCHRGFVNPMDGPGTR